VPGLPVKAGDAWSINVFVKTAQQPENRTIIAGFGRCEDTKDGGARYLAKFAGGVHFWSRVRDVTTRSAIKLNAWQMLTATYDGSTLRVYQDGKKIGEGRVQLADDENVIQILPQDPWEHKLQFQGEIRNFTVWGNALTEEAIKALQAGYTPKD
jgi:alpha-mannosidase